MKRDLLTPVVAAALAFGSIAGSIAAERPPLAWNPANAVSLAPGHPSGIDRFAPELPAMLARVPALDPDTGLHVAEIEPDLYFVTEGIYQSAFLVTRAGVVVFDAPPSYAKRLRSAIERAAPGVPITHLIYSHGHVDHVGGSPAFGDLESLRIVASAGVAERLSGLDDGRILVPGTRFEERMDLTVGGVEIRLRTMQYHAEDEDTLIHLPAKKFLMAVDTITPGEAPFMNFGATADVGAYLAAFEVFLAHDFEHFLSGHVSVLGTRDDVLASRDYAFDVRDTVQAGMAAFEPQFQRAFGALGHRNANLAYRYAIEVVRDDCAAQVIDRWRDRLSVVDVWASSHCEQMLLHAIMH